MEDAVGGVLALADIGGYTAYLSQTELDHSTDILADLLGVVIERLGANLTVAKLEGDAVFCYGVTDGITLLSALETCYAAFNQRLRDIARNTTCGCAACRAIDGLTLKFVVHHGAYAVHDVSSRREVVGLDVIKAHRLLNNTVTESFGLRGYALLTRATVDRLGIDDEALGLRHHLERYDDVGVVPCAVHDLETWWRDEEARRSVRVTAEDAVASVSATLPGPTPLAWEWLTSPHSQLQWISGVTGVGENSAGGSRGVGTTLHCMHGKEAIIHEFVDWKPVRYYSTYTRIPKLGTVLITTELTPVDDGTHVEVRVAPLGGLRQRMLLRMAAGQFRSRQRAGFDRLRPLLAAAVDQADAATVGSVSVGAGSPPRRRDRPLRAPGH